VYSTSANVEHPGSGFRASCARAVDPVLTTWCIDPVMESIHATGDAKKGCKKLAGDGVPKGVLCASTSRELTPPYVL